MKLQFKLVMSFGILLLLIACTTFVGWLSMGDMGRMATQIVEVDHALASIQYAQLDILRYVKDKNPQNKDDARDFLQKADVAMSSAQTHIKNPNQMALSIKTKAGIENFGQELDKLVAAVERGSQIYVDMLKLIDGISTLSTKTMDILEKSILEEYNEVRFTALNDMNAADSIFYQARIAIVSYAVDPSPANAQLAHKFMDKAHTLAAEAQKMLTDQSSKDAVQHMLSALTMCNEHLAEYLVTQDQIRSQYAITRERVINLVESCSAMSVAANQLLDISRNNGNTMNLSALGLAIFIGIGITLFLTRNITRQLGKDPGELAIIANRVSHGEYDIDDGSVRVGVYSSILGMVTALKEHIDSARKATIEAQAQAANAFEALKNADAASKDAQRKRDSLLVAADKLEDVAHVVSSASEQLTAQIEESERGSSEQATRVGETATAMEEMNSTVLEVARNAGNANDGGKAMRLRALEGARIVESSVKGVQKARNDALALKEDMNTLSAQAQAIGQIMNVISDIADQTNLLALNAAIEAARAGEAGRGFAVVADEVRKLAEKTMQSTTDVGNAINSIQTSAAKNMAQVDATVQNIETSSEQAEKSGLALREIVSMIDATVDQISAIATASEEQSATSEEINRSLAQVNIIAGETARAMQEAAQAVSDLSHQAQVLTNLIGELKKS